MPRDILEGVSLGPYKNAFGKIIENTHVEITYYKPMDDNKYQIILPVEEANAFANKKGVNGPYVSSAFDKDEMKRKNNFEA